MIKVCMIGLGRTGNEIAKALYDHKDIELVAALCSENSTKIGKDLGDIIGSEKTDITVTGVDKLESLIFNTKPDVIIDFSNPQATLKNAEIISKMKVNMIIGTTGFTDIQLEKLYLLTKKYHNGIVYAPNITLGVNVSMLLANIAANILNNYDFHINEVHHKHKKDSPSGTAIKIAKEIEKGLFSSGTGTKNIPISSVRAGGVIGKHEVFIIGENDKIEITHESISRKAFAEGTIRAVEFIKNKVGYYEMADVLNLKKVLNDYLDNQFISSVNG